MMQLPSSPSQACLTSFALAVSLVATPFLAMLVSPQVSLVVLALFVLTLPLVGLLSPNVLMLGYRAWNKLARACSCFARDMILRICFYVVFVIAGLSGSLVRMDRPAAAQSSWATRETLAGSAYFGQHKVTATHSSADGWISSSFWRAVRSGEILPLCLLPFLLILRELEPEQERQLPPDIYTLF
jgi:hypothetical protein